MPCLVSNSPINPSNEMFIMLRPIDQVDRMLLNGETSLDETYAMKKFVLRPF